MGEKHSTDTDYEAPGISRGMEINGWEIVVKRVIHEQDLPERVNVGVEYHGGERKFVREVVFAETHTWKTVTVGAKKKADGRFYGGYVEIFLAYPSGEFLGQIAEALVDELESDRERSLITAGV